MTSTRPVAATLWVGNLPFESTEAELHTLLSQIGPIKSLRLIQDRETGKPKGFAFCEYYDKATSESAFRNLNGTDFKGRPVRLDYAQQETTERDMKVRAGGGGGGGSMDRDGPARDRGSGLLPPIGFSAAAASAGQVAAMLGGPPASDARIQDQLNELLGSKSRPELWEVLRHLREFVATDPGHAHRYFADRPGLTKAVFQAQVLLGMVKPVASYVAAGAGAPPPPPRAGAAAAGGPMGLQVQPGAAGGVLPAAGPMVQVVVLDASGQQQTVMMPASQLQGAAGAPVVQPQLQAQQLPTMQLGGQQPQPVAMVQQQQQPVVLQQQAPPPQPASGGAGQAGGMFANQDPAQMQALLRQVQTMSDEQINGLPDNFKQQVLYVKEQIRLGNVRLE